jgi:predicted CoA-binding protein
MDQTKTVVVIGASQDRSKFGNKAVRAYRSEGWVVYPINPHRSSIEGIPAFRTVQLVPQPVQRAVLYVQPEIVLGLLEDIATHGVQEIFFNPGTESVEAIQRAGELGLQVHVECAIVAIGRSPSNPD